MFQEVNNSADNISFEKAEVSKMQMGYAGACDPCCQSNMVCPSICEAPRERICHRYFCYDVPHIIPCNTRIINHHVYKHSYIPQYTCCEENECQNVYDPCQNNFF